MSHAASASPHASKVANVANRRLLAGLLLSLLVHAVILSIQFGVPGMLAGSAEPITVTLAPAPAAADLPPPLVEEVPQAAADP
ncbi:MAG TPA: hypothetical protein DEP03_06050, partial [Massilia sp.]|nr:hypothetical protein [Massilia sp.]